MKIGLFETAQWPEGTEQGRRYHDLVEQCVLAEELGYDSIWLTEHHFSRHGITSDSLALLSNIAARTKRIRLGTAVLVLPFHDPVRLAETTAIVDHLSGGRLDVGIGRGYQWTEYNGFGVRFDEGTDRFEEALGLLVQGWTAERPFAFDGKFHRYDAAAPQPRPVQRPHPPLWHATTSDNGLRRCAEAGWGVMMGQATSAAVVSEIVERYRGHVQATGAVFDAERMVLARGMYCGATDAEAEQTFLGPYAEFLAAAARVAAAPGQADTETPRNPFQLADGTSLLDTALCGSPQRCIEGLRRLADLGIEHVLLFVNLGGIAHGDVVRSLERFASDVLPAVR